MASEDEGIADALRRMANETQGKQNEALIFEGSAHAQAIFRTPNGSRLTSVILERLIDRTQLPPRISPGHEAVVGGAGY